MSRHRHLAPATVLGACLALACGGEPPAASPAAPEAARILPVPAPTTGTGDANGRPAPARPAARPAARPPGASAAQLALAAARARQPAAPAAPEPALRGCVEQRLQVPGGDDLAPRDPRRRLRRLEAEAACRAEQGR